MVVGAIWTDTHGDAGEKIMQALRSAVKSRKVMWANPPTSPTHTIVILTEGAVARGSATAAKILQLLQGKPKKPFLFVYSVEHGWDFGGAERRGADKLIDDALNGNEAMAYRPAEPPQMAYEHQSMVDEMLTRLNKT